MKAIKIILSIIIVFTVVFFSTGLFVKQTNYTSQVTVNKSLEEVFTLFNDMNEIKNWIPEIQSIAPLEVKDGVIGSTYKMVVLDNNGQPITMEEKVLAYVENEKVTLYFDADGMLKTDDYVFTYQNNQTTITNSSTCKSNSYILSCIFPYFKGTFQEIDQGYLNNFKAYIEQQ